MKRKTNKTEATKPSFKIRFPFLNRPLIPLNCVFLSCNQNNSDVLLQDVECGDINSYLRSGVIMRSTCRSYNSLSTNDCHTLTVQQLNMTLQKELPVFATTQNVTYRSIACAKCHNEESASFWHVNIFCKSIRGRPPASNLTAVSTFLN